MVEEMYQQELNEAEDREGNQSNSNSGNQTQTPPTSSATEPPPPTPIRKRPDINPENDTSLVPINRQQSFSENQAMHSTTINAATVSEVVPPFDSDMPPQRSMAMDDVNRYGSLVPEDYETGSISAEIGSSTLIRFGPTTGDVSLTLGLRHAGNVSDETNFSIRDFGSM
jgi:hypothetical protein